MDFNDILRHDEKFRYQLLSRMKSDCDYYLGNGNRYAKHLWGEDEVKHIAYMKALWNSFGENGKPEWLTYDELLDYENKIGIKAILVERDYKGEYERFALTPEEFEKEFPDTVKHFGPIKEANSDTLYPLVHIWFCPTVVGSEEWNDFFTDMELGLPESDIESGNLAYIRKDFMRSLGQYLEDTAVYHCRAAFQHDNLPFSMEEVKLQVMSAVEKPDFFVDNFKCVEENKAEVSEAFPDDYIFTFEFDIKMSCDSHTDISNILDKVSGGELLSVHYERSADKLSLEEQVKNAMEKALPRNKNESVVDLER